MIKFSALWTVKKYKYTFLIDNSVSCFLSYVGFGAISEDIKSCSQTQKIYQK